jgi:hypothetical protein
VAAVDFTPAVGSTVVVAAMADIAKLLT